MRSSADTVLMSSIHVAGSVVTPGEGKSVPLQWHGCQPTFGRDSSWIKAGCSMHRGIGKRRGTVTQDHTVVGLLSRQRTHCSLC